MFARTARMILRPAWPEDAARVERALSHPDVAERLLPLSSVAAADPDPRMPDLLAFARTRGAPRLIGGAAITTCGDGGHQLSYWIDRTHWGLGFATEAAGAVLRIARANGLGAITASQPIDNPASRRVLVKLGFRPTGRVGLRYVPQRAISVPFGEFALEDAAADPAELPCLELYKDSVLEAA